MTDAIENDNLEDEALPVQDELTTLKARADQLGIKYHPTISLVKLREKVNAALAGDEEEAEVAPTAVVEETLAQRKRRKKMEAMRLVRVVVQCMNPAKKEWDNEVIAAGNSSLGTIKRLVPFANDEGWHVEQIILNQLQQRQCQIFVSSKDSRGNTVRKGKMIKEFQITILPDLTTDELAELAQRQAVSGSIQQ